MEASLICQHINHALKKMLCLLSLIEQKYKVHKGLKEDIEYLDRELGLIACTIGDEQRAPSPSHHTRPTWEHLTEDLRDLGFEIEDCIDRLLYCSARVGQDNILKRAVNFLFPITLRFADDIRRLKKKTEQALEGWKNDSQPSAMDDDPSSSSSSSRSGPHILRDELEGIDAPLKEIIELLDLEEATPAEQPGKLKVISIVGSGGVGKTVLAREAFDSDIGKLFTGPRAWVSAADSDAQDVLRAILQELKVEPVDSDVSRQLRARLDHERYFIVIDDMRKELWCTLRSAFPSNSGYSSRIIVTTSIHSVAKACSSGELDHVYTMATLGDYYSKKLFSRKARCSEHNLEEIVKKCDGLPLALDSIAQFMRNWGLPQEEVCKRLGFAIDKDDTLARLRRVLHHNYTNLPGGRV